MNKISIIVPIYKVEKYLDKCITSLVGQTYKNIEIILVDDGSPDNCPTMCDEWAKKDERIKVIHKANGGLSDARNHGIEVATGDYLMFVDSDDYVSISICEKLLKVLQDNNADVSMCEASVFYEGEDVKSFNGQVNTKIVEEENLLCELYHSPFTYFVTAWAKLYKKEIFNDIRYPVGKLHEDEYVIYKIMSNIKKFVYTSESMYYYLLRKSSITGTYSLKNYQHIKQAYDERYQYLINKFPNRKNDITLWHMAMLRYLYCEGKKEYNEVRKQLFSQYKQLYKTVKKHNLKHFVFRHFPWLYVVLFKMR